MIQLYFVADNYQRLIGYSCTVHVITSSSSVQFQYLLQLMLQLQMLFISYLHPHVSFEAYFIALPIDKVFEDV